MTMTAFPQPPFTSTSTGKASIPPSINVEEKIDRLVGRRTKMPEALSTATSNQADAIAWRKALGGVRVPRGVIVSKLTRKRTNGYGG